jgi:uncharacterized membrane protein YeaQ/YmgE (transglycosylase-associated protein family)
VRRLVIGLLCAVAGYVLGAFVGYWLITWLSSSVHDRSVEAAMTGAFVFGPIGALVAFFAGFVLAGRRSAPRAGEEA